MSRSRWKRSLARLTPILTVALAIGGASIVGQDTASADPLPSPPAGFVAVTGCDTGDDSGTYPETPTVYIDPAFLATVPEGATVPLHGSSASPAGYNFYDPATSTWTGQPVPDKDSMTLPQCVATKRGTTLVNPQWSFCANNGEPICQGPYYNVENQVDVNSVHGNVAPTFVTPVEPLTFDDYQKLNWLVEHNGVTSYDDRNNTSAAIWCVTNHIPDGGTPGYTDTNGAYVPTTGGSKTYWDHCPIDITHDKTTQNVATGAVRDLSPAWMKLAANGDPTDPNNNNWSGISQSLAMSNKVPTISISGPAAPVAVGDIVPFTITMDTDQVNLKVPQGMSPSICADDTTGAIISGQYLFVANPAASGTTSVKVCLPAQAAVGTVSLGFNLGYIDPSKPDVNSGGADCQGLVSIETMKGSADATITDNSPTPSPSESTATPTPTPTEIFPTPTDASAVPSTTAPPSGTPQPSMTATGQLAKTGSNATAIALVALTILTVGGILAIARRRRTLS